MLLFVFQVLKGKIEIIDLGFRFRGGLFNSSVLQIHFSVEAAEHDLEVCEFFLVCLELYLFIVRKVWPRPKAYDTSDDEFDLVDGVTDMEDGRVCQSRRRQGDL